MRDYKIAGNISQARGTKTMELEGYFDFLAPDDIRIKGMRIGIETVLYERPNAKALRFRPGERHSLPAR
jgi:hypothetical protein